MPFDVAFSLDDVMRAGMCIIFSEIEGQKFDFEAMAFRESGQ